MHILTLQLFDKLDFEDIGSFLPPGFSPEGPPPPEASSEKPKEEPKLGISSLFDNIETSDISALLPPGFNPEGPPPPAEEVGPKVKLPPTFGTKNTAYSPKPKGPPKGPGVVIPKIKSFADR